MSPRSLWPLISLPVLLLAACSSAPPPAPAPRPVVVEAPQPMRGSGGFDSYPGTVHARVEADLSFRIPGKIAARKVELGTRVKPGMVLATLDPQDARLNLDAAQAAVAAAEADFWLSSEEEKRYADLKARGHVGQSMLDQRVNANRLAKARLEQARSQLDLARNQSRYTQLTADVDGVVTQVIGEPGNVVTAGQPVLRIAADGEREVRVAVPEGRVETLRNAPQLVVEIFTQPGSRYAAKVRDISPQADRATRTHEARVTVLQPDDKVQLGSTATVMLADADTGKTFRVPATALGALDQKHAAVWTVVASDNGGHTVKSVPVQVVQYLDGTVVVAGSISAQQRLVTAGVHLLVEGMAVQPIDRAAKAAL